MKVLQNTLLFLLLVVLTVAVSLLLLDRFRPTDGGADADGETAAEAAPLITGDILEKQMQTSREVGRVLSWVVVGVAALLQLGAWIAAVSKLREVQRAEMDLSQRFQHLEAIEVYFDLPLYFGLLGTVMSFVLITVFPDAGLMFAYMSTALGIVVSVILRLGHLTPYRQRLIAETSATA